MDTSRTRLAVAAPPTRSWRRHSDEFKARVIELARKPNTSVAAVAPANGLYPDTLRRWVRESEVAGRLGGQIAPQADATTAAFVQSAMHTQPALPAWPPEQTAARGEVEIRR